MKNHYGKVLAVASLMAILGTAPSLAQITDTLRVKVPFEFVVGDQKLSAGEYSFIRLGGVLRIQAPYGQTGMIVATNHAERKQNDHGGRLVFTRYGDTHFLTEVWSPANTPGQRLRKSPLEIELAQRAPRPDVASVAIQSR